MNSKKHELPDTSAPLVTEERKIDRYPTSTQNLPYNSLSLIGKRILAVVVIFLLLSQYAYGVIEHSSLISIQFATSVLAFCSVLEILVSRIQLNADSDGRSVFLLYRTAGIVFFIASLFLNLTHCLENLSDLNPHTTSEEVNQTTEETHGHNHSMKNNISLRSNALHSHFPRNLLQFMETFFHNNFLVHFLNISLFSDFTLYISIVDIVVKTLFALCHNPLSINKLCNFIVLVPPSALTIFVYYHNQRGWNYFFDWLNHHLEPVTAILMTVTCIGLAIYSLYKKKQYLLAEGPKGFSIEKISDTVKSKNPSLDKVDHVHASCEWPGGFTVSLKAYIKVEKTNKDWVARAATNFSELKTLLHSEIKAQGAKEVIVEPVFVDSTLSNDFVDSICIDQSCHKEDVGCCTIPKNTEEA
ncbi:hypothetical protein CAEBREN_15709 [Caenorhabditis brenneri]|uniref:Uncharacterized protein n=1 Tax=Caenorhabditis brenneri TaxID=135651 RepID=G0MHJ8_CAEBE|nr:hypothetical protein CAEBREN_15709 [Caenorhabditis brenneri]